MADNPCMNCKYAEWERTKSGRLHPDKSGKCSCVVTLPPVPNSTATFHYRHDDDTPLVVRGGWIWRNEKTGQDCPCFEPLARKEGE